MQDERQEIQMQTLNQDIKNGCFRPVYLLYGDETFLVRSYKNRLKEAIASRMKIAPFIAGKLIPQARAFSREQILSYVRTCVEYEEAVKSGWLQDRLAVELLITKEY